MNIDLLTDIFYAAPEFWYFVMAVVIAIAIGLAYFFIKFLQYRQKNYFLNRDRERYAETLFASKDGYFAFIYPDQKINDPRKKLFERCSRRLAVILNLQNGTKANFDDVLKCFYKDDARKIVKYVELLMEEGVSFEDEYCTKNSNKKILMSGCRINGLDGNIYCDMIWFRDVTSEAKIIETLKEEKEVISAEKNRLDDMLDNVSYPIWMRDEKLNLIKVNKRYTDIVGISSRELVVDEGVEILNINGDSISKNLAFLAVTSNKQKKQSASITIAGERKFFEVSETPFYADHNMEKIYTIGTMTDISELDEIKRNIKTHQNSHLEILGFLDTAIAVFDSGYKLSFYNDAFASLWKLESVWLESKPSFMMFMDLIREKRLLPEVPDFIQYKNEEAKDFTTLIASKEDLMHLPDGRSLRRIRSPHPMGGLTFAFEDISDKLAMKRAYNSLLVVRKEILDNILDAVLIFGSEGRCKFYNKAYMKLWKTTESFMKKEPTLEEVIESQKSFFDIGKKWETLKKGILGYLTDIEDNSFILNRKDNVKIEVSSTLLSDESIMVIYRLL